MRIGLKGVSVEYGRRPALTDVTLDLGRPGRIVGLFGPNGAGKTTTIRVLAGVLGRYRGERVVPDPGAVAYLPDDRFLYPWLRLREATALFAARYPDFRTSIAAQVLETLGLDPGLRVRECSRGMSEQIHIALTLARSPQLYVFDEPLASVDPATRRRVLALIREFRHPEATLLMSTHLIESVATLFDDLVVIDGGRILVDEAVAMATGDGTRTVEEVYLGAVGSDDV